MKKVSKAILIGVAIMVALVAVLLVGLNLYVQSAGAQARIQEELSKALRLPLKITKTSITPWSDLRITGISIPNGDANFLEAASFSARYRLLPLLDGKLVITEMQVESPKLLWVQNAEGKWKLPSPEKAAKESLEASKVAPEQPAPTAPSATETKPAKTAEADKSKPKKKNFAVIVDRFEVKDGVFELLDKDRKHVAMFNGVNMIYTKLSEENVEGTAKIARAVWADGLTLEEISTPFSFIASNHEFWLPDLTATLAGGTLRGNYRSRSEAEHTPFSTKLEFDRINMDKLVVQTGGTTGQATGELRGKLEMRGETDRMEKAQGEGQLNLREGRFRQFELFQAIGRILNISELADFRIQDGQADFRVAGDKLVVEQVDLQAPSLDIKAKGTIRLDSKSDRKVSLDARLSVDKAVVARLPGNVPESFATDEQGRRYIDFTVGGTTAKLKTNLGEKLISQTVNAQFGSLLGNIFDRNKEEDQQRKRDEEKRKKEEEERKKVEKAEKKDKKKKDKENKDKDKDKSAAAPDAPATPDGTGAPTGAAAPAAPPAPAGAATPNGATPSPAAPQNP